MTTLSGSPLYFMKGFDEYVSSHAAHDQDRPGGPSARVEYMSCVGDCAPLTFAGDVRRTALAYGKGDLEVDAYSYVLSHSHEELDPAADELGAVAHGLAREWVAEAFPGRQAKIVTQRDNGRWEGEGDDRQWVEGHWHSHIMVANVAEQEVTLRWTDAKGVEKVKHYKAGRAIDGDLKNIFRLRHITDEVVMRQWKYDNAAYVEACRRYNEGAAAKMDYAQRAEQGYSTYDEVRLKLRTAAAQAVHWDDYVTRCQAAAVDVKTRGAGGAGVSYAWVGDDGLERKARARGKTGIGPEFTRAEIEKRCEQNVAVLERGGELEIPEQVLVAPSTTVAPDRPRPQYLTEDGRPPWESTEALAEYERKVQATGGTYEARAERALATGEPVEGVELICEDSAVVATVDAGDGAVVFDIDAALAERVAEIDAAQAALAEREATFEAKRAETVTAVNAAIDESNEKFARADEALAAAQVDREAAAAERAHARTEGYDAGLDEGRAAWEESNGPSYREKVREVAVEKWETETAPALRDEIRTEIEAEMRDARDEAQQARNDAQQALDEARRRRDAIPVYDPAEAEKHSPAELIRNLKKMKDATGKPVLAEAHRLGVQNHKIEARGQTIDEKTFLTETRAERNERLNARGVRLSETSGQAKKKRPQGEGPGQS